MYLAKLVGALALTSAFVVPALASPNLVQNGSFENSTYASNTQFGPHFGGQGVTNWTGGGVDQGSSALEFYYIGGTQTTTNAVNEYNDPKGYFYPTFSKLSPDGGNFVALDGDPSVPGSVSQTVNGLTVGKHYSLVFDWAATQLINRSGKTTELLDVSFGGQSFKTANLHNPSGGFTPSSWATQHFDFTATSASQVLTFISRGTPSGLPPIAVLDGVSLTQAPEPAALALFGLGVIGLGASRLRRR